MKVSAQYASEHFEDLAAAADKGEEVEIAREDKPMLKLVSSRMVPEVRPGAPRVLGAGKALTRVPTEEEWVEMDRELEAAMNGPIFPDERVG